MQVVSEYLNDDDTLYSSTATMIGVEPYVQSNTQIGWYFDVHFQYRMMFELTS